MRVYHLLIAAILLALSPFILKTVFKNTSNQKVQPQPTPTPTVTASPASLVTTQQKAASINVWKRALETTKAPTGWNVAPCNGSAPFLCVSSNGKNLGSVKMAVYPVSQSKFQKMLNNAGINTDTKIDYQNPSNQSKIREALNAWVTDEYAVTSKERQKSYKIRVDFSGHPPQKVNIGQLEGVRYGFTGLKRSGGVQEHHLKYVAFDGSSLYVINTAYDPIGKYGKFDNYENLAVFEPYLSEITSKLKLP